MRQKMIVVVSSARHFSERSCAAVRRPAIRPAAEERAVNNVVHVAATEIFNARASDELRAAADDVLKVT